jgi:stress response protein YsnF
MEQEDQQIVPVLKEELHADTIPVKTGGVRVIKHVEGQDEILQQELRKGRVQVKRVKTDRVVDGPQPVRRAGNTLIVPVVSERLRVEKEWIVTEEIHITQVEERETVEQKVRVNVEHADVERLDEQGNVVGASEPSTEENTSSPSGPPSIIKSRDNAKSSQTGAIAETAAFSSARSIIKDKAPRVKKH